MNDNAEVLAPNHHGDHAGFAGISGWLAALSMRIGRSGDAQLAIDLTALAPGEHVLDIGCGPGVAARAAAARGAVVTGIDPADVMLRVARRDDRQGAVTWKRGAAEALPVPDGSCDVVWSLATVHHWPDLDGGLAEVRRVLSADGRFLAIERRVKPGAPRPGEPRMDGSPSRGVRRPVPRRGLRVRHGDEPRVEAGRPARSAGPRDRLIPCTRGGGSGRERDLDRAG